METALLLAFSIAIVAPFKMKYWNMGANGQVLVGALAAIVVMFYMEDFAMKSSFNNFLVIMLMLLVSIIASIIWGVIPAMCEEFTSTDVLFYTAKKIAVKELGLEKNDRIVITGGDTTGHSGNTNLIKIVEV